MPAFTGKKGSKATSVIPGLSFHNLLTMGLAIEIGLIATLSIIILERFNITKFYELLITILALIIMVVLMIRNHLIAKAKAETTIGRSEKEVSDYKHALDSSAIVVITDQRGVITYVNENFCTVSKYTREELIGQTHRIINSGYHSQAYFRSLWLTIAHGRIWKGEIKNKAKDGTTYWADTTIVPFLNAAGKPYQYLSIRFDITERKNMEEALRETEANLKTVFENTESAYILLNNNLEIVALNKLAEQFSLNCLHREGKTGEHIVNYFPPDRQIRAAQDMKEVLEGHKIQYEISYRQPDESVIWYHISLFPVSKTKRVNYGLIIELCDITQRKKAEENLRQSQANLMAIVQNTDSTIYSIDRNRRYITFNKAHSDILNQVYGLDIKTGDHVFNFLEKLDPEETKGWQEIYTRAFKGETVKFEKEFNLRDYNGFVSFSIYPIWENEQVIGLSCFTADITGQKKAEMQKKKMTLDLIQRNKDLEHFSYIVSHNLRESVATTLGLANVIKEAELSDHEKRKAQDYLFSSVEKLDKIVKDLNHQVNAKRNAGKIS